jgi:hypothetical protein
MKRFSRWLMFLALAGSVAVAIYESRLVTRYRRMIDAQANATTRLKSRLERTLSDATQTTELVQSLRAAPPASSLPVNADSPVAPDEISAWLQRVNQLRQAFASRPGQSIPQLDLLSARDWATAARTGKLETEEEIERALAQTRTKAKSRFASLLFGALESYLKENKGELPAKLIELLPYLDGSAQDPTMLESYELVASGKLRDVPADGYIVKEKNIVNEQLENRIEIIHAGNGKPTFSNSLPHRDSIDLSEEFDLYFLHAARAFVAAHQGALPTSAEQLIPFFEPALGKLEKGITFSPPLPDRKPRTNK